MAEGVFAHWQPRYAEHGIATFPVTDKRPAVSRYLRMGLRASRQLVSKFGDADALGLACGSYSRITVVDVDTPDERVFRDALDRFGPTPFLVRSGSGNHQAWYRHNGERRSIRPDPVAPIDILGGGYVVAPPSRTTRGRYEIITGSLADLASLPTIRSPVDCAKVQSAPEGRKVARGERNEQLWRKCMCHAPRCEEFDDLMRFAAEVNLTQLEAPLPDEEVARVAASAWKKECAGENFFAGRRGIAFSHEDFDAALEAHPDAFVLWAMLKRRHWGREFCCANAMAASMPPKGWTIPRFARARNMLLNIGAIIEVRPTRRHDPAVFSLKGSQF